MAQGEDVTGESIMIDPELVKIIEDAMNSSGSSVKALDSVIECKKKNRSQVKWAQFLTSGVGPPPTTRSGRWLMDNKQPLVNAVGSFGRDIDKANAKFSDFLSGNRKSMRGPIEVGLTTLESMVPIVGQSTLYTRMIGHLQDGETGKLAIDVAGTKPVSTFTIKSAILAAMMSHRFTRPVAKYLRGR